MRFIICSISLTILFSSCYYDESESLHPQDVLSETTQTKPENQESYPEEREGYLNPRTYNTGLGDPDTSLAVWLFFNADDYEFASQFEEYARYDLEHQKIVRLIKLLYSSHPELNTVLVMLEHNRVIFIKDARNVVLNDIEQYGKVDGKVWEFLVERNDSLIGPLVPPMDKY
jgi:hypothetical protein